ncbi:MAG TPA: MTH938/NDUFAF3 family protein [Pseudolabrys sp.]|nr:MTH938/NDUFAF3 family protein [Pseudolabrys sp.]
MAAGLAAPHLPYPVAIDAYGNGGFRFGDMSHRGSLLCLPDGIWAWPVASARDITEAALQPVFERADTLDLFLIGAGRDPFALPAPLQERFRTLSISVDCLGTGPAAQTYNILLGEKRRVAAGLIAVP